MDDERRAPRRIVHSLSYAISGRHGCRSSILIAVGALRAREFDSDDNS